jgi:hypothetical protein
VNEEITGNALKPVCEFVPPGVITITDPDGPDGTTAVIVVEETTVNDVAATPPKLTDEAPVKPVPVIITVVPAVADAGKKDVIKGGGINVNPESDP